jgi:hypothetical protein
VAYLTRSRAAAVVVLALAAAGCKRTGYGASDPLAASLIFDNGSPEAREALATPVDFRLTDDNFPRWAEAQSNLDDLPISAIPSSAPFGRNAIDRAMARLESNPRARQAIESAGLSVRDFVLETVALAQAAEVAETGKSTSAEPIPPDNFQFVQRYRGRVLLAGRDDRLARDQAEAFEMRVDSAENGDADMNMQMDDTDADRADEMRHGYDVPTAPDDTSDFVRDTIPVPRLLSLRGRQPVRGRWRGQLGDASLERMELRSIYDQRARVTELHLRDQLVRSHYARLLERMRRKPSVDYRRLILPLLQQHLKQIRDSLRIVAGSRDVYNAF